MKLQILKTLGVLITTAFALVAALAWNEAIKAVIDAFFKQGSALTGLLVYALLVTVLAVVASVAIGRLLAKHGIELDD